MEKQALDGRNRQKPQRTHKMWVSTIELRVKCSYFEIFIVVNRPYLVPPYYSLQYVQILNGSSDNLTPSYTTRDAFMINHLFFLETWA